MTRLSEFVAALSAFRQSAWTRGRCRRWQRPILAMTARIGPTDAPVDILLLDAEADDARRISARFAVGARRLRRWTANPVAGLAGW